MLTPDIRFDYFFDRKKVVDHVDKKSQRVLSKTGRFAQMRIKSRMRKGIKFDTYKKRLEKAKRKARDANGRFTTRDRVYRGSKPGEPPRVWNGLLKNRTFFNYEPQTKSVVVGPMKIRTPSPIAVNPQPVPATLEYGGTIYFARRRRGANGQIQSKGRVRRTVLPRPYIGPVRPLAEAKFKELLKTEPF